MKRILLIFLIFLIANTNALCAEPPQKAVELYNNGIDYYQAGEVQKSINSFNEAIKVAPEFYEAYYNLGQIQASENKLDDAIKTYTVINNLRPSDYESTYTLGKLLHKRGYLVRSLSYYKQIPVSSSYYLDAQKDMSKIVQRQKELQAEADNKAATAAKLSAAQKNIEQKFTNQNQIAGAEKPFDKEDVTVGSIQSKANNTVEIFTQDQIKSTPEQTEAAKKTAPPIISPSGMPIKPLGSPAPSSASKSTIYEGIPAPSGVAMDSNGNTYIASFSENLIYKINSQNQKSIFVNSSVLNGPIGLAVDDSGNVYVANYTKGNILKVTPNGAPSVFLTIKSPYCLNITNNILFITEQSTNTVVKYTL